MKKKYHVKTKQVAKAKLTDVGDFYPIHSDAVMFRIDESLVSTLIDLNSGKYYSLNLSGTLIWRLADGTRTAADIKEALAERFPAISKNGDNVDKFLKNLIRQGFLIQRNSKVRGIIPSDLLRHVPDKMNFAQPKMTSTQPEPLNVFGMPGGGGY